MSDGQAQMVIPGNGPGDEYVSKKAIWILLTCFCLLAGGLITFLVIRWPALDSLVSTTDNGPKQSGKVSDQRTASARSNVTTDFMATDLTATGRVAPTNPTPGTATSTADEKKNSGSKAKMTTPTSQRNVLILVLLAGALGGALYSLISMSWYIGNRELKWSWVPSYAVRPLTAAALACIFFLTLVAGVWTGQTGHGQLWIVGVAALVGLFSKQGYEKLKMIFEALFTPAPKGADTPKTAISSRSLEAASRQPRLSSSIRRLSAPFVSTAQRSSTPSFRLMQQGRSM